MQYETIFVSGLVDFAIRIWNTLLEVIRRFAVVGLAGSFVLLSVYMGLVGLVCSKLRVRWSTMGQVERTLLCSLAMLGWGGWLLAAATT